MYGTTGLIKLLQNAVKLYQIFIAPSDKYFSVFLHHDEAVSCSLSKIEQFQ